MAQIIKAIMSSAAEAEIGALFINAQEAMPVRVTLSKMGHVQPHMPMQTENTTAMGVITNTIQPRRTKAMDMCFHWLRDREVQRQLRFYWREGTKNLVNYPTKHRPTAHHRNVRSELLTPMCQLEALRKKVKRATAV